MSTQHHIRILLLVLFVVAGVESGLRASLAAAEAPGTAADNTAADNTAADDAAAKQQILNSPAWSQAMEQFDEWLSVQIVYPKEQVPQLKANLQAQVDKMSADQLRDFLE
ncbi:MAG: hypothetical protein JJ992_19170, partial [Planctomycetes bacterium]|nr:hypothetical protein [Planctomycetota bacterium]